MIALQVRPRAVASVSTRRALKAAASGALRIASQEGAGAMADLAKARWSKVAAGGELLTPRRVQIWLVPLV
jgi:hypothetical protein